MHIYTYVLEKAMAPHSSTLAWRIPWMEEPGRLQSVGSLSQTRLSDFTLTFHFHALEKEMATHSSVLALRIPGMGEPGGLPSMGSHRVRHDWSDLAAAAVYVCVCVCVCVYVCMYIYSGNSLTDQDIEHSYPTKFLHVPPPSTLGKHWSAFCHSVRLST